MDKYIIKQTYHYRLVEVNHVVLINTGEGPHSHSPTGLQLFLFALQTELQHFALQVRLLHTLRAVLLTVVTKVTAERQNIVSKGGRKAYMSSCICN